MWQSPEQREGGWREGGRDGGRDRGREEEGKKVSEVKGRVRHTSIASELMSRFSYCVKIVLRSGRQCFLLLSWNTRLVNCIEINNFFNKYILNTRKMLQHWESKGAFYTGSFVLRNFTESVTLAH